MVTANRRGLTAGDLAGVEQFRRYLDREMPPAERLAYERGHLPLPGEVPLPTACDVCDGDQAVVVGEIDGMVQLEPCTGCCCGVCGDPTDTPPECARCQTAEDARAVRRADR